MRMREIMPDVDTMSTIEDGPVKTLGRHSEKLRELRRWVRNRPAGKVVVDGRRLVEDLVRWGVPVRELFLSSGAAEALAGETWLSEVDRVWVVADSVMEGISPTRHPQGVLAIAEEPAWAPWNGGWGCAVYLERVQEPGNVGAVVRSAAALGAAAVLLSAGCADPFSPAAVRGSAGAVFRVPIERDLSPQGAAARVGEAGGSAWATGSTGVPLALWRPSFPVLLMFGSEGSGLSPEASELAGGSVTVPLERDMDSLNVAVAAGILLQSLRDATR